MAGQLLIVEKAAAKAGCSTETLRRAIRTKELLAHRHPTQRGRPFLIDSLDLAAFLEKRRRG